MLEGIFGNRTAEKVLFTVEQFGESYPSAVAKIFEDVNFSMAYRQFERFERAGLLVSQLKGRTRLFTFNPRYVFLSEVRALLRKGLESLPTDERRRYFGQRRRPRRTGKPAT